MPTCEAEEGTSYAADLPRSGFDVWGGGTIGLVNHNHKNKDNENSYNDSNNNNDTHNEITATIMLAVVEQDEQIST